MCTFIRPVLVLLVILTLVTGLAYPLLLIGLAQVAFPYQANGSLLTDSLLATLIKYAGRVVTHRQLLREVWGPGYDAESHYLRVYMAQLRHKLEADPTRPKLLLTEPGVGYRLREAS
ncbi:MAG: hypothetical protein Fur005_08700 [Roseiflexaceae bacterium]